MDDDGGLISFLGCKFAHDFQLLQLCDRIAAVGYQLTVEDIVIGIQPLLYNRKNVFAVDG